MGAFFCASKIITKVLACTNVCAYYCPMNNAQNNTMKNANTTTEAFKAVHGRIEVRAMLHASIDLQAVRNYGGENNATMNGKYYATNRGMQALRLTYGK